LDGAGPALGQALATMTEGVGPAREAVGRLRLSVPGTAVRSVIEPVLPRFRTRHPRIEVEVAIEERLVDIVAEGYDAGVAGSRTLSTRHGGRCASRPVSLRVVGAPAYLTPPRHTERPEDSAPRLHHVPLADHGALYAWELERGRRTWAPAGSRGVVTNAGPLSVSLASVASDSLTLSSRCD